MFVPINSGLHKNKKLTSEIHKVKMNCQMSFRKENDNCFNYYRIHFKINEEKFYGHIETVLKLLTESHFRYFRKNRRNINAFIEEGYREIRKVYFDNYGYCFVSKSKLTGQPIVLKHIIDSESKYQTNVIVQDTKRMLLWNSIYLEKLLDQFVIENDKVQSIWYVLEYTPSFGFDLIKQLLHKVVLNHFITNESEFVHLLYTCNGSLDKSKETFPSFINIIGHLSAQLLVGLSYLHERGIIHKNLNPANINVTLKGQLKITDLGFAKRFRLLQYHPRCLVENGIGVDYLQGRNPTKRMRLAGNFHYLEPHFRSIFSCRNGVVNNFNYSKKWGYHVDYFSCAMMIFELVFGFTFGDIDLYKKYSFYEQFNRYELIFFFPYHYIDKFKDFPNLNMAIEDFNNFKLNNLKSFLVNHENGFVDFIIEGLSTNVCRWSTFYRPSKIGQCIDITTLQKEIPFFQKIDFNNLTNNIPLELLDILKNFNKNHVAIPSLKEKEKKKIRFNLLKGDVEVCSNNSLDSKMFCIPELKITNSLSSVKLKKKSLGITEKSLKPFQHKTHHRKKDVINNSMNEKENNLTLNISPEGKATKPISVEDKEKADQEEYEEKRYSGVFLHKLFNNVNTPRQDTEITDHELHEFMKSQLKTSNNDEEFLFQPAKAKSVVAYHDFLGGKSITPGSCYRDRERDRKMIRQHKIDKQCSSHSKNRSNSYQRYTGRKYKPQKDYRFIKNNNKCSYIKDLHLNENHNKGLSVDFSCLSEYQLDQFKMHKFYNIHKTISAPSSPIALRHSNTINEFRSENTSLKNIYKDFNIFDERFSLKNVSTFGSTNSDGKDTQKRNTSSTNQSNSISFLNNKVLNQVQSKALSLNHTNYLETKMDTSNYQIDNAISSKFIHIDKADNISQFSPQNLPGSPEKTINKMMSKSKNKVYQSKFVKSPIRNYRKKHLKRSSNKPVSIKNKQCQLVDSDAINLLSKQPRRGRDLGKGELVKNQKDETIQTWSHDIPVINCSTLFSMKKKQHSSSFGYPTVSVASLTSKECQTFEDLPDININTVEVQTALSDEIEQDSQAIRDIESDDGIDLKECCPEEVSENQLLTDEEITTQMDIIIPQNLCVEAENEVIISNETVDFLNEIEMTNPDIVLEKSTLNLHDTTPSIDNELLCCNDNESLMVYNNFVEEISEPSERTIELFKGIPVIDASFVTTSSKEENNTSRKSVSFRSPVISDIFDSSFFKFTPEDSVELKPRGILKDNLDSVSLPEEMSFFYRPKVNKYDLEIIDDWLDCEEIVERNTLNQEFDLKTIENNRLTPGRPVSVSQYNSDSPTNSTLNLENLKDV